MTGPIFGSYRGHGRRPMKLIEVSLYEAIWLAAIGPILDHDTMPHQHFGVGRRLSNAVPDQSDTPGCFDKLCLSRAFFYTTGLLGHGRGRFLLDCILFFDSAFSVHGTTAFIMHFCNNKPGRLSNDEAERLIAPTAHISHLDWAVATTRESIPS